MNEAVTPEVWVIAPGTIVLELLIGLAAIVLLTV
jgi:hypothetical protein